MRELSTRFQIPQSDYLSMLARLGEECVGALMFRSDDAVESRAGFRPLTQADADELHKSEIVEIANAMQIRDYRWRGAQSKTGWYLPRSADAKTAGPGQWMLPIGSAPSAHIIKVASGKHPDLPTNEQVCMDVAQASGLCVAGSFASEALNNVFISGAMTVSGLMGAVLLREIGLPCASIRKTFAKHWVGRRL